MSDWEQFKSILVFMSVYEPVRVEHQFPQASDFFEPSTTFQTAFPTLTTLLRDARVTHLTTAKGDRYLYSWTDILGNYLGWLTYPCGFTGSGLISSEFHSDHRLLLEYFGGTDEDCYREIPESGKVGFDLDNLWTNNLRFWLGERDCKLGFGVWDRLSHHEQATESFDNPINGSEYVTFAEYADGGAIAYHKQDARVVLSSLDNSFDKTTSFGPEALYTFDEAPNLRDWVEKVSHKWAKLKAASS
jgi:hypothetical protein